LIRNILLGCFSYGKPRVHNAVADGSDGLLDGPGAGRTVVDMIQLLTAARGLGLEKEDCAVLFHVLAKLSGVPA
jgi:hypothetical protein